MPHTLDGHTFSGADWIGRHIDGRWPLEAVIDRGATTLVFETRDGDERRRALKLLDPQLTAPPGGTATGACRRFIREAECQPRCDHPDAVKVFEYGISREGYYYMVLERLTGRTLADVLATDRRPGARTAVTLMSRALELLEGYHRAGVVHRSLAPAAIFVERGRRVRLLDFSRAHDARSETPLSGQAGHGGLDGAPAYLAPEQTGEAGESVDPRVDVFAAGAILYELLAGRPLRTADTPEETLIEAATEEPPSLASHPADHPAGLIRIVDRAVAPDPAHRFDSPAEMKRALERFVRRRAQRDNQSDGEGLRAEMDREFDNLIDAAEQAAETFDLEEQSPREREAARPDHLGVVPSSLLAKMPEKLTSRRSRWRRRFGTMLGALWLNARKRGRETQMQTVLRRFATTSLQLDQPDQLVHDLACGLATFQGPARRSAFVTQALDPSTMHRLLEALLPTPEQTTDPRRATSLERLGRLVACMPADCFETLLGHFAATNEAGRRCLRPYLRRHFDSHTARLEAVIPHLPAEAATDLLDETIRHHTDGTTDVLRGGLEHRDGWVRAHSLDLLGLEDLDLGYSLGDPDPQAKAAARREMLELARSHRRSALIDLLADRVREDGFPDRPLAERCAVLEALAACAPSRAAAVAIDRITDHSLVPWPAETTTRIMAVRLLSVTGGGAEAVDALERAARPWWWNSPQLRECARRHLESVRAHTT